MEVEVAFRVRVEVVPVVRFLTTFSRPSTARTAHLQALLDALVADPPRLGRVADLLGRQAVLRLLRGHQEEEDEGMYAEIAALLRPLVAGLPEEARGWLAPALSHWAWLPHTEDGSTLLAAVTVAVDVPVLPDLERDAYDELVLDHYSEGGTVEDLPPREAGERRR